MNKKLLGELIGKWLDGEEVSERTHMVDQDGNVLIVECRNDELIIFKQGTK